MYNGSGVGTGSATGISSGGHDWASYAPALVVKSDLLESQKPFLIKYWGRFFVAGVSADNTDSTSSNVIGVDRFAALIAENPA